METVIDIKDDSGDDDGIGAGYGYPEAPEFLPGILDITRFRVRTDGDLVRFTLSFRALSDPGWHPEYGFQLTFATIAIRTDERERKRTRDVARNSHYRLPRKRAADRLIHIGGGFEVFDGDDNILLAHHPFERGYELGDVASGQVSFTMPLSAIGGHPGHWRITVLVGAQDDHGGAGVGEFRTVGEAGGLWEGSGGSETGHNVYDMLMVQ
jgi:carbohydrate-binding DOMON domain-containing protein